MQLQQYNIKVRRDCRVCPTYFLLQSLQLIYTIYIHLPLQALLGNPKDIKDDKDMSGIYEISCHDCNEKYVNQSHRSIHTRP